MGVRHEIFEQPEVLARLLDAGLPKLRLIAAELRAHPIDFVYLVARGSSDNAGIYASYLFGAFNRIPVALALPSLFTLYKRPPRLNRSLVIAISQSGQSPDLVRAVKEAGEQGAPTLVITNSPDSPLAAAARHVLDIGAGPERAVAATKSYTAQLLAVGMLSAVMAEDDGLLAELRRTPELVSTALALEPEAVAAAGQLTSVRQCVVLGRGFDYATAHEWALKLKELTYVLADSYSSADFMHGPIAVVERGFAVLAVNAQGAVTDDMAALLRRLQDERGAEIVVVSNSPHCLAHAKTRIRLPTYLEPVSPIVSIVPGQLVAYHLALLKGLDPDQPRGLLKVTSTE